MGLFKRKSEPVAGDVIDAEINASNALSWRTEKRRIGDLVEWEKNPRRMTEKQAADLQASLTRFGYVEEIVLNADGRSMIGGHQRRKVLLAMALLDRDAIIDVRIPSRQLTDEEAEELAIRLNKNTGEWDSDLLANLFDEDALKGWGFTDFDFGKVPTFAATTEDDQGKLDQSKPNIVKCPSCGHEFNA